MIRRLLFLAGIALIVGAGVRLLADARAAGWQPRLGGQPTPPGVSEPDAPPEKVDGRPRWRLAWSAPIPGAVSVHLADDGATLAWVDRNGSVRRVDGASGKTLWQTPPRPGVARVLACRGGRIVAWSPLNALKPLLLVLNPATGASRPVALTAALWSVAASADGTTAWVGAGDRSLTAVPLDPAGGAPRRIALDGIPESLAVAPGVVVAGLWLDSGVVAVDGQGGILWTVRDAEPARRYSPLLSADGSTTVLFSAIGPEGKAPMLSVFGARDGKHRWEVPADGADLQVALSGNGARLAVTAAHPERHGGVDVWQHKLSVYGQDGEALVRDKGSRFFDPRVLAVSARGERITVCDGARGMTALDARGRTLSRRITLPVDPATGKPVSFRDTWATPDGRFLLVRRGDGQISLFKSVD